MYDWLRQLTRRQLRSESDASLNTTGLVHEAYLKLVWSTTRAPAGLRNAGSAWRR